MTSTPGERGPLVKSLEPMSYTNFRVSNFVKLVTLLVAARLVVANQCVDDWLGRKISSLH